MVLPWEWRQTCWYECSVNNIHFFIILKCSFVGCDMVVSCVICTHSTLASTNIFSLVTAVFNPRKSKQTVMLQNFLKSSERGNL